jgi:hypothetical protein
MTETFSKRDWSTRKGGDFCVEWQGSKTKAGYGNMRRDGQTVYVHRWIMEQMGHDISGKTVMHSCDNPACYRYEHLSIGTHHENMQDAARKFRGRAKLTADQVREIRSSSESSRAAGRRYGVDKAVIQRVRSGKSYAHVQ